ncbi:replicative DNA helicase [Bacillus atrophaeus]|uniref:replicative DNA helicase n=1 Tax=Bacillus atrophaeus TaxID=1452 RepID=UPI0022801103|nr:replicative DNA helicase [Bacillus atrophaeus]MCY8842444.1 replicative DNA helicase [Bacillus atrophaeus]MEC0804654.1 replicative DNA helicase [Bacillus atrophaeus]MEC0852571.1 replicative DNA helicase [Bacillus atrophaeus]MEC0859483.1 replicative DNA helicase [Bacillus atrophaeus]MEC0862290.1 replicative DNA helicase [Bacillus atrophaeus]
MNANAFLYNTDAEQTFLGALLIEPELIKDCRTKPLHLSQAKHKNLLSAMLELDTKGTPIDLVSITEHIGRDNLGSIGGHQYLSALASSVPTTANIGFYEKIIFEYWQRREMGKIGEEIKKNTANDDPSAVIQSTISDLMRLEDATGDEEDGAIQNDLLDIYEELVEPKGEITGMRSGFAELDRMTSGFQKQELVIIAARPSVGKTAFCLNVAQNFMASPLNNNKGGAVGIFSLEMSRKQLLKRMTSSLGNINAHAMRTGNLTANDWNRLSQANGVLGSADLRIFDRPGVTVNEIWSKVRKMKREFPNQDILIIIDYLQLISGSAKHGGNRTQEIGEISRMLKHMARELDICVIALSQLSRAVEQRQDKRPMMSDIRESGQIEQDADVIGFLYRDDYYDKESERQNIIEIIIGKQRNGPVGTVSLAFIKEYGLFVNLERGIDG